MILVGEVINLVDADGLLMGWVESLFISYMMTRKF